MTYSPTNARSLLVRRSLKNTYIASIAAALIMAGASAAGFVFKADIYLTDEARNMFVTNDLINLLIGLPALIVSMWMARRGRLIGLLLWPGALFYIVYNYMVYAISMPFRGLYLLYSVLILLSVFGTLRLLTSLDGRAIQLRLKGAVSERFAGGVLVGFGALYFLRALVLIITAMINRESIPRPELALHIADMVLSLPWIIGGVSLWRKRVFGYMVGLGLLFQASTLFIGLIILMLISPYVSGQSYPVSDIIVIFIMGFICFIPFGLFVRGVLGSKIHPES
jgi:hypothetical protein